MWDAIQARPVHGARPRSDPISPTRPGKRGDRTSQLVRARFCGPAVVMSVLHCLYGALLGFCDYWICLCEYTAPSFSANSEVKMSHFALRWIIGSYGSSFQSKSQVCVSERWMAHAVHTEVELC